MLNIHIQLNKINHSQKSELEFGKVIKSPGSTHTWCMIFIAIDPAWEEFLSGLEARHLDAQLNFMIHVTRV